MSMTVLLPKGQELWVKTHNASEVEFTLYTKRENLSFVLPISDFLCIVEYVLTNTNLVEKDERSILLKKLARAKKVPGWGSEFGCSGQRLAIPVGGYLRDILAIRTKNKSKKE